MTDAGGPVGGGERGDWGAMAGSPAVRVLSRMLAVDRLPHALLFCGPEQVGKAGLALTLAQALNCEEPPAGGGGPCAACRACRRIAAGKFADVETVAPGGLCRVNEHDHRRSQTIGICQVRRLEMTAVSRPYEGRHRVFVVDPADALTDEAADAFLKTLEEPPAAVTLVLISARAALLPETVRSRCRRLDVAPLPVAALAERLAERDDVAPEAVGPLARLARGRAGWLSAALGEGDPLAVRSAQIDDLRRLSGASRADRLDFAASLGGGGDPANARTTLEHWREWWRDLLRVRAGSSDGCTHEYLRPTLEAEAARYAPADICAFLRELQTTEELLRCGVHPRRALGSLLLAAPPPAPARETMRSA